MSVSSVKDQLHLPDTHASAKALHTFESSDMNVIRTAGGHFAIQVANC